MITHLIHFFSFCPTPDMNADKMVLWVMWVEIDHQHPTFLHINHQTVHYIIFTIALIIQSAFFVGIIIDLLLLFTFCYYLAIRSNTRSQRLRRQWVFFNFLSNTFLENVWWWVWWLTYIRVISICPNRWMHSTASNLTSHIYHMIHIWHQFSSRLDKFNF